MDAPLTNGEDGAQPTKASAGHRPHPVLSISRRLAMIAMMMAAYIVMLMLRSVPSMAMQGTGSVKGMGDKYKFSNSQIGAIYSCWGWGYTLTQMPGGYFGQRIGSKKTWLYFMSAAAISSMLIPLAASTVGVLGVAVLNGISGMGQGPLYPVSAGLFGAWLPQPEYARGANAVWSMWSGGQMIQGNLSPWIMTHLGWEYTFYIYPALILLWAWVWRKYAHDTPAEDPACSAAERAYIEGASRARPHRRAAPDRPAPTSYRTRCETRCRCF